MKRKFCIVLVILGVLLLNTIGFCDGIRPWARDSVKEIKETGLLDEAFFQEYQAPITRGEFAEIAVVIFEVLSGHEIRLKENIFIDTENQWVHKAYSAGIVSGYPDGTYREFNSITREEISVLLGNVYRALGMSNEKSNDLFTDDGEIPPWAKNDVYWNRNLGVVSGIGNNIFQPKGITSKEQAIVMMANVLESIKSIFSVVDRPQRIVVHIGEDPTSQGIIIWHDDLDQYNQQLKLWSLEKPVSFKLIEADVEHSWLSERNFKVYLDNLTPNTQYFYQVGKQGRWSKIKTFRTLDENEKLSFGFLGDAQSYNQEKYNEMRKTYDEMQKKLGAVDFVLHAGDIVDRGEIFEQWQFLDNAMGDVFSNKVQGITIGNHDNTDQGIQFENTFSGWRNGLSNTRTYYFEIGHVIVVALDTESPEYYEAQKSWLADTMNQSQATFKIVMMHRSAYPMKYYEPWIEAFSQVFEKVDVDLVLSGHDHIYSRTTMEDGVQVDVNEGVTYVSAGSSSGSKFYDEDRSIDRYWKNVVYDKNRPVFTTIEIENDKLVFKAYAREINGVKLIDTFELNE